MPTLANDLRNKLERVIVEARDVAEIGARAALESLAVHHHEPYPHMKSVDRELRNHLRARARQLGDRQDASDRLVINHLVSECAYEHWHRMLFARFLAENNLLIEPEMGVAVSLEECTELAKEQQMNLWALAGQWAQVMLPEIFRADDPVLKVNLALENQLKLEQLLNTLPMEVFSASDSLGWCYQFWQSKKKEQVNKTGNKIGADELPAVTQLFTEDYMVDFLLDNTLGAWWAGKKLTIEDTENTETEEELRKKVALPGVTWDYLRFVRDESQPKKPSSKSPSVSSVVKSAWRPAAGTFDGWPETVKELKCLDPCCGSGHFLMAMFDRLFAMRMVEEELDEKAAVAAVIRDNLFGLEIDPRCTQLAAFSLATAAWRRVGYCALPQMHIACSGIAPNAREADWLKLAGNNERLRFGMARLYHIFHNAPVLGSLINPSTGGGDLLEAGFQELRPLFAKALAQEERDDTTHEMAVTAQGIAKAAEILADQFILIATNVPYLARGKQCETLQEFCETRFPYGKTNLATAMIERSIEMLRDSGSIAVVSVQIWLFQGSYSHLRESLLNETSFRCIARLGLRAFQTQMWDFPTCLFIDSKQRPKFNHMFFCVDCESRSEVSAISRDLRSKTITYTSQKSQKQTPSCIITCSSVSALELLGNHAKSIQGVKTGDDGRARRVFWELSSIGTEWRLFQSTVTKTALYSGLEHLLWWGDRGTGLARKQGIVAWGRRGIAVSQMSDLPCVVYLGEPFDSNMTAIIPKDQNSLEALLAFCSSNVFQPSVHQIDQSIKPTNSSFEKVPFDLSHWQNVAAKKYPHGLPKPFSNDPTQWLFTGHPNGADQPLQVAVARLLGYRWPRQTGSNFPDCPALGPDGLEKLADDDGIVCIPSVRGELPAVERLRELLAAAYGRDWKAAQEAELLRASGSEAGDLEEWLRNEFFAQHCIIFHQRPFIWHIWDGRKRDGFHALVNYHKLCEGNGKGRKLLESLTYSYLGDWITRQRDGVKRGEGGAEDRLAAALELQNRLKAIAEGEPPFDIFVRWKPLHHQPIGWNPDINDGVRLNIRPFLASDLPNGRTGAGILRFKPNIKWGKDRGKEPHRPKAEYPWFWGWDEQSVDFMGGKTFDGNRWNDCHYSNSVKQAACSGLIRK